MSATKTSRQEPASVVLTGRATPLYVKAFRILEAEIAGGILAAGALVQESQLVDRFGISRAPARQARLSSRSIAARSRRAERDRSSSCCRRSTFSASCAWV